MKNNYSPQPGKKHASRHRIINEKTMLGFFSLASLLFAAFCALFLNTAHTRSASLNGPLSLAAAATPVDSSTGCPTDYTALGGVVSSQPSAGVINGRVVVFALGTDGAIYFQNSTGFPFSGWKSLGGKSTSPPMTITVGTALFVEVVGTDGNHYYRSTTNGGDFVADWTKGSVGATTTPTAVLGSVTYTFVSGLTGTSLNLCAFLNGGATPTPPITATPTPTPPPSFDALTGCPTGYTALGGIISSEPSAGVISNRVVAFARGTDGEVYFQYSGGAAFSVWNKLNSMGGQNNSPPMTIVIGTSLIVEIIGADGNHYYKKSTDGLAFGTWTQGSVGAALNSSAILGTTLYNFVRGSAGTQPNLCTFITPGVAPTPTPTITPTPTPTAPPNSDATTGCATSFTALGGVVGSVPSAGVINGRVFAFIRGTDGAVYYQSATGFTFSGWNGLGGGTASAPMTKVVGSSLYVEVIGTDNNHYYRSTSDGSNFADWIQGTVGATTTPTAILGSNGYNFASGLSGTSPNLCVQVSGASPTPTPTFTPTPTPTVPPNTDAVTGCPTGYRALGGIVTSAPTVQIVANKVIVFARGTDGAIYYQSASGSDFSGWVSLGGATTSGPASKIVGSTLYVEATGTDNQRYYRSTTDGATFTDWTQATVGATINSTVTLGTTLYNFVSGLTGSQPNLCTLLTFGASPTPTPTVTPTPNPSTGCSADFISLGGIISSDPTAVVFNNRIYVFADGTDGGVYYQFSNGSAFSGWNGLGGGTSAAPMSAVINATLYLEVVGTDSNRYYRATNDGSTFTDWTAGTVGAQTTPVVVFGGRTYTFAKGNSGTPHLCLRVQ